MTMLSTSAYQSQAVLDLGFVDATFAARTAGAKHLTYGHCSILGYVNLDCLRYLSRACIAE